MLRPIGLALRRRLSPSRGGECIVPLKRGTGAKRQGVAQLTLFFRAALVRVHVSEEQRLTIGKGQVSAIGSQGPIL